MFDLVFASMAHEPCFQKIVDLGVVRLHDKEHRIDVPIASEKQQSVQLRLRISWGLNKPYHESDMWQKALLWSHDGTGRTAHPNRPMAALARTICRAVELEWALNQNSVFVRASIFGMDSYKIADGSVCHTNNEWQNERTYASWSIFQRVLQNRSQKRSQNMLPSGLHKHLRKKLLRKHAT